MNWRAAIYMLATLAFAALPASNNYQLGSYGFGTGGTAGTTSSHYSINGIAGDAAGLGSSSHYKVGAGVNFQQQADAPLVTLSNDASWYNKLRLTISPNGNPTNATYAVAISPDNFVTTYYIQPDLTMSPTLVASDFQTYTGWGGSSGVIIRGLSASTVYTAKASAYRGSYTQSGFGPTSSGITTDSPQLSFEIDVSATDQSTSPPYVVSFGNLLAGSITTSPVRVWISLATNAESGGNVYVSDQNSGLTSVTTGHSISSANTDISTQSEGYGAQGTSATQSGGGPLALLAPFDGSGGNVGGLTTSFQQIFSTSGPITAGRGSFKLLAKTSTQTPSAADYGDILTAVAAASF